MTTESNTRDQWSDPDSAYGAGSFHEHGEQMKAFRRSHIDATESNPLNRDKPGILGHTRPLKIRPIVVDTGGIRIVSAISDWSVLVAALEITRHKFWQN